MNKRQRKKTFKKRFGINPPRNISIRTATWVMEHRKKAITILEWIKVAMLNLWEWVKQIALEVRKALIKYQEAGMDKENAED